jgi:hypothetical protein
LFAPTGRKNNKALLIKWFHYNFTSIISGASFCLVELVVHIENKDFKLLYVNLEGIQQLRW